MPHLTFDLWNGRGTGDLGRLIAMLDADRLRDLDRRLAAMADRAEAVDARLADRNEADRGR